MSIYPVGVYELYCCLHLILWWDHIIHLVRVHVCFQSLTRGVCLLPLIEGLEVPPELFHIRPRGVGRPHRRVTIPMFHSEIRSARVYPSCGRFQTCPDLSFYLLCSFLIVRHNGPLDGSGEPSPRCSCAEVSVARPHTYQSTGCSWGTSRGGEGGASILGRPVLGS